MHAYINFFSDCLSNSESTLARFFFALAMANLIFNIFYNYWHIDIYVTVIVFLLYSLNTYFLTWWQNRNNRNNPTSFRQFVGDTYLMARFNKLKIVFWISALIISIVAVLLYTGYTRFALLGWLLAIFLVLYNLKKLFYSFLPPEWFLHDINTGYVFLSIFVAWGMSDLMSHMLSIHFVLPMLLTTFFCLVGIYLIHGNARFLVPGCSLVLADIVWQIIRIMRNHVTIQPQFLLTEFVLIAAILVGLIWLIKKPGIIPILYLTLFQLFRFSTFTEQAIQNLMSENLTPTETHDYVFYLVCWMFIVPLIFWFMGLYQKKPESVPKVWKKTGKHYAS